MTEPKIVLWDLETIPNLSEVMKIMPSLSDYPGLTLKASINSIICFGYKIYGTKDTNCINIWDLKNKNINDDYELCKIIQDTLKDADAIVTHNGKRFDLKFLQTRLIFHGLPTLPKIQHIDTCTESKKNLLMFNNRLNTLAKFMTSEEKMENGGWELWVKVLQGDKRSMKIMSEYCKQDVVVLEKVFKKLMPFINNLPNHNRYSPIEKNLCPNCGSSRVHRNGFRNTKTNTFLRYRCIDCGTSSHAKTDKHMLNTA